MFLIIASQNYFIYLFIYYSCHNFYFILFLNLFYKFDNILLYNILKCHAGTSVMSNDANKLVNLCFDEIH